MALSIQAQVDHLKFMGIPITGKISNFDKILKQKGFRFKNKLDNDTRVYDGPFAGEDSQIFVNFNNKTKNVYKVKVTIGYRSETNLKNGLDDFSYKLKQKYNEDIIEESVENGRLALIIKVYNKAIPLGLISLYSQEISDVWSPYPYYIHIDYIDIDGYSLNNNSVMDDL